MRGRDGGGGGTNVNPTSMTDIWSYRHTSGNEPFVDAINDGLNKIATDFPSFEGSINNVDAVTLRGAQSQTILGYWDAANKQLAMNQNFTDVEKMNAVMDEAAQSGYHPSRGNLSGTEAVALHEAGHALTDQLAQANGYAGLHSFSEDIVRNAYKNSGASGGVRNFAGSISRYAQTNYAEAVAEATADWYCNGNRASSASIAIMNELRKYG